METSVMNFNRFNHGSNYNPHAQYDYINPIWLTNGNVNDTWLKLWDFNLASDDTVKRAFRSFHISFDFLDILSENNLSSIHFDISANYQYSKPGIACSKRYNSIDENASNPMDYINVHFFYQKVDSFYHVKIYLKALPGTVPVLYNARFWNMLGYDPIDPQFYPSNIRTNAAQLQVTRWLMQNIGRDWVDIEQMMADTEGYTHVVGETANFRTGRNLLKGTLDFNADNWQVPTAGSMEVIDGQQFFKFTKPNEAPFNINQEVELVAGHHYTISFSAKVAQRSLVNFEVYGIGDNTADFSLKPVSFFMDEKVRRYSVDVIGHGRKLKRFLIKPILAVGEPLSNIGGGVWLGRYTLNDVAFDRDWRPFNE